MNEPNRRSFLQNASVFITGLVGLFAGLALGIPLVGYFLGPTVRRKRPWVNLGDAAQFPVNETRLATFDNPLREAWDGQSAFTGVYVRNLGSDKFQIFAVNCAHLGCPVTWFPQSGLFMCPCHGGVYYENGQRASGPPPRGLFECDWKLNDGQLSVQAPHYPTLQNTLRDKA